MTLKRRDFVRNIAGGALLSPSLAGLWSLSACDAAAQGSSPAHITPYGRLVSAPGCPGLEIPETFRCVRISSGGVPSTVNPDLVVPNAFDGMASFAMDNGNIRLIRNHEMVDDAGEGVLIGKPAYDPLASGGTTSLEVRITGSGMDLEIELVNEFVSLAGTRVNCAGGPTPWGSWLTCEENTAGIDQGFERPHGYIFEVPGAATGPVDPVALKDMGRFVHEAIAVDPDTGFVYETEDAWYIPDQPEMPGAGLYRFLPTEPGRLAAGGRLQMLAVTDQPNLLTARGRTPGVVLPVHWVDIDDPDPANAAEDPLAVFKQGYAKGAAAFARLEGAFYSAGSIYVVSTNGGEETSGQVFRYAPTTRDTGELTLVFESPSSEVLDGPDNVCVRPGGGLIMCEDAAGEEFVRGLDADAQIVDLVRQPHEEGEPEPGEFCGSCFSADGRVMFVNVQGGRREGDSQSSGTYAIWGPWEDGPL